MKKKSIIILLLLSMTVILICGCGKKMYYEKYISECKYNILTGQENEYMLKASLTKKEFPYYMDGKCGNVRSVIEIHLFAPDNTKTYSVFFEENGKQYGGEMNYNSIYSRQELCFEYENYNIKNIDFIVESGEESFIIKSASIITTDIISSAKALNNVYNSNKDVFDKVYITGTFEAEIHVRLLSENEKCYYYIGIVDDKGKIYAFLIDAVSGEIIAQKEINYRTNMGV